MIEIENLTKVYRTEEIETTALNSLSIQVKEGEFVSIMGESGCGKSTLLNVIGLLDTADGGTYSFDSVSVSSFSEQERAAYRKKNMSFIFQNFNLIDDLNVFENVELPLVYLKASKGDRKKKVKDILERVGIAHRAKHFPQQLSGGQQQRVAIARALVSQPKLILADEPTGNLDSKNGIEVMELLTQLNDLGTTIVMVTHSQHDANFSSRTIRLLDGKVINETNNKSNTKTNILSDAK